MKLKKCDSCDKETIIWKNQSGHKFCKNCWYKTNKAPKIKPMSEKRKIKNLEYSKLRLDYLEKNPICQIKFSVCTHQATDIHHIYNGENRDVYLLIQSTWRATCRNCHYYLHNNSLEAKTLGLLK